MSKISSPGLFVVLFVSTLAMTGSITAEPQSGTGSILGTVVRWGSNEPVAEVDVELIRVEGTSTVPLGPLVTPPGFYSPGIPIRPTYPNPIDISHARTAGDGKFRFANLLPGKYKLWAARSGSAYYIAEYGQRNPRGPGMNFQFAEGQVINDLKLPIAPNGTISGIVFDADGAPAPHVRVMAFEATYNSGRRLFQLTEGTQTNDRGEYRLYFLPPGRYTIAARPEDPRRRFAMVVSPLSATAAASIESFAEAPILFRRGEGGNVIEETYTLTYLGGITDPQMARLVDLSPGGNIDGIDISLRAGRVRAVHIRGTVTDSMTGKAAAGAIVSALSTIWSPSSITPATGVDADGHFDLSGVGTGKYSLIATLRSNNVTQRFSTSMDVSENDIDGLKLVVTPGVDLRGRISVDGIPAGASPPDLSAMNVVLLSEHPNLSGAGAKPIQDGTFTLQGIQSGTYRVFVEPVFKSPSFPPYVPTPPTPLPPAAMQGMYVKSIRMGADDAIGGSVYFDNSQRPGIAIVLGMDGGSIDGTVVDSRQQSAANAVVALVPESQSLRSRMDLYKSAVTDESGQFHLQGISPGNYILLSWDYVSTGEWFDTDFIRGVESRGKALSIGPGRNPPAQLTLIGVSR